MTIPTVHPHQTPARLAETELRMALRHVRQGQACIARQMRVLATLRDKGLPTERAEQVLQWLEKTQGRFDEHYRILLNGGERIEPKNIEEAPHVEW
jgi:hypothetical protein